MTVYISQTDRELWEELNGPQEDDLDLKQETERAHQDYLAELFAPGDDPEPDDEGLEDEDFDPNDGGCDPFDLGYEVYEFCGESDLF